MSKPITAYGFRGMSNLPRASGKLLDDERRLTPSLALNCEVTDGGVLRKRSGYLAVKSLSGCHSLAGEERGLSVMLCMADGGLYRLEGSQAWLLAAIDAPRSPMSYVELNNLIYLSNPYWKGVYDLATETVRPWGVSLPPTPDVDIVSGDLPPGAYKLTYTNLSGVRLGGNGPLSQVSWAGGTQGIRLNNLPAGARCWITHPNGSKLFLAQVSGGVITGQAPQDVPLPSFMVTPPPFFSHFQAAFGRMWGVAGKELHYSEPFQYEWFNVRNTVPFLEELVMVAPVTGGLFVNSRASTWFLDGTDPAKMELRRIGGGALPGTLVFAQLPGAVVGGGYEISRRLSQLPSPVWVSRNGLVAGTHTGHLVHLTEARLKVIPRSQGAGFYQVKNGIPRLVMSMCGPTAKDEPDDDLSNILSNGRLFD